MMTTKKKQSAASPAPRPAVFDVSTPVLDFGTKYVQDYHPTLSPPNVCPIVKHADTAPKHCARMEDVAYSESVPHLGAALVAVADGHGAMSMCRLARTGARPWWCGGYEYADLAATASTEYIKHYLSLMRPEDADPTAAGEKLTRLLIDAFIYAQGRCTQEAQAEPPETSLIDGAYFETLKQCGGWRGMGADPNDTVVGRQYLDSTARMLDGVDRPTLAYVSASGDVLDTVDQGSTLTVALLVPDFVSGTRAGVAYVAHAGDSDAYLFPAGADMPTRITTEHSKDSESERQRVMRESGGGITICDSYFHLEHATHRMAQGKMLQPSRGMGHMNMKNYGITHLPVVVRVDLAPGDVLVVASDGLWDSHGTNTLPYAASILKELNATGRDAQAMAKAMVRLAQHGIDKRDNVSVVCVKVV
ncbi:Serine/Thr phosphatase 2c [Mollivirus sibericum]|uniref:Serine/Thr phosphatase 2c n=1 Tax=Mollivirus sibericum TaxID=1678078 RepID=UPI0006B2E800|nr:Serine/Thr phosphatase 2c [Mollivirus sibericum]ALD62099.1 Serine/Thr phosphatase 2c [Mollivirus sibericum]